MARFGSFGAGLAAGVESGLNRLDRQHTAEYQGMTDRHKMSQQGLTQLMNVALKYKEAGKQIPPEIQEMLNVLAKQTDRYSTHMGLGDAGMHEATTQALAGLPVSQKARGEPVAIYDGNGQLIGYQEAGTQALFDALQPEGSYLADKDDPESLSIGGRNYLKGDLPGDNRTDEIRKIEAFARATGVTLDEAWRHFHPAEKVDDNRTDKMKNAEAYAKATGVSKAEAFKHLFPGEKVTDSRTTDQKDFEYWRDMPKGTPEEIDAANRFAQGANLNLTEDKGTELQQNLDHFNSLPEGKEKEIWRKKLGVGDDDPAKIELFKAYQNLPAEQQVAYDNFYKSEAKDSRTALMKNFDFLNSISDPEQKAVFTSLLQPDPSAPSIVREWAIVSSWSPEKQAQYLDYRKQIATMNAQQQMTLLERILGLGQDDTGAGNSILNKVITEADAANPQTGPVVIKNDAEYEALPSGTVFIGPDGVERTKP